MNSTLHLRWYIYGTLSCVLAIVVPVLLWVWLGGMIDVEPRATVPTDIFIISQIETAEVPIPPSPITILHVGDVMLDRYVQVLIDRHGIDWVFAPLLDTYPNFFFRS